jgi:hypothetical protein
MVMVYVKASARFGLLSADPASSVAQEQKIAVLFLRDTIVLT